MEIKIDNETIEATVGTVAQQAITESLTSWTVKSQISAAASEAVEASGIIGAVQSGVREYIQEHAKEIAADAVQRVAIGISAGLIHGFTVSLAEIATDLERTPYDRREGRIRELVEQWLSADKGQS